MKPLAIVLIIIALIAVIIASVNYSPSNMAEYNAPSPETYNNIFTDPFYVHESTGITNYTFSLPKGTYFIEIASSRPFSAYYNVALSLNGSTFISLFTENFEFHGILVNRTSIFTFTVLGKGKWLFSQNAQDPDTVYSYPLNGTDAFVLVPPIGEFSAIKVYLFSPSLFNYEIYDSLLIQVTSYLSSEQSSIETLNFSGAYDGIIFVVVNGTSSIINVSWIPNTANNNNSSGTLLNLQNSIIAILFIAVIIILYIAAKNIRKGTDILSVLKHRRFYFCFLLLLHPSRSGSVLQSLHP